MGSNERRRRKFIKQAIYFAIGLVIFLAVLLYARRLGNLSTYFYVSFENPDNSVTPEFTLEIADTEEERAKGLMFRKEMESTSGMIFVYPKEGNHSFWMKNTYIPLDMIFIGKDWQVVGVVHNAPILNTEPRKVDKSSQYVIELNAGTAKASGIREGSRVVFKGESPVAKD